MKLLSIRLCNFRQFYGKTPEVILAHSPCNTTVIHGNNGAGKTTLLNAFTWVLYEKFTAAFASPHLLVNKRAITEAEVGASVDCWVEVQFEHDNKRYQVKRKCYACRDREGIIQSSQSKFFMLIAGDDGRWYPPLDPPEDIINRILPESLHQYFFFDGEQIDRLFRSYDKSRIAEDTKELLGVKVLDRAIEHLKKAKRTLQEELEALGDIEIKQLLQQLSEAERESDRLQQRQQDIIQELSQKEDLKKDLTHRLLDMSGAAELKQLKETLEIQEAEKRQHLIEAKRKIKQAISSRGHTVFLPEIIAQFQALINDLRIRGELPSGIKQQFVRQLLENQRCICGGELLAGSDRYQQVQQWMNRAGMADVEEAAIRLESQVDELTKQGNEFWQEVDRQQSHIQQLRTELAISENQLDDIRQKFRRYPDCDIQSLQNQLDEIEDAFKDLTLEQGANKHQQHVLQKEIEGITKQLNKHKLKQQKQSLAQRRIQVTQEAIARLIEVRTRLENQFRLSLEKRVQAIFYSISFTPYIPRIQTNYELSLVENTSGIAVPVAASTGENQILSLSFIGGIIDRVREWSQKNTLIGPDSSTFPIVMDSPFGSLDEIYRRRVARSIPQLANQLIVLVTQTQWRIEVEAELSDYIGKEYVLVYNSSKPDCEEDAIAIGGETYPLVKPSPNEFEYTEILEVKSRD
jgi:DNA sulfur modification protein DndD